MAAIRAAQAHDAGAPCAPTGGPGDALGECRGGDAFSSAGAAGINERPDASGGPGREGRLDLVNTTATATEAQAARVQAHDKAAERLRKLQGELAKATDSLRAAESAALKAHGEKRRELIGPYQVAQVARDLAQREVEDAQAAEQIAALEIYAQAHEEAKSLANAALQKQRAAIVAHDAAAVQLRVFHNGGRRAEFDDPDAADAVRKQLEVRETETLADRRAAATAYNRARAVREKAETALLEKRRDLQGRPVPARGVTPRAYA